MPINDPEQYEMEDEMGSEKEEYFLPWPSDTNDKPFMTYDKLMTGAPGKAGIKPKKRTGTQNWILTILL